MADKKISQDSAAAALDGDELIPAVQGGDNVTVTPDVLKVYGNTDVPDPTTDQDTATKKYVDDTVAAVTPGIGAVVDDTTPQLGGDLDAQNNLVHNVGAPVDPGDAATKGYVDDAIGGITPGIGSLEEDPAPTLGDNLNANGHGINNVDALQAISIQSQNGTDPLQVTSPMENQKSAIFPEVELEFGATIDWSGENQQVAFVVLTGNAALAFTDFAPGGVYVLHVRQDGTGGHTLDITGLPIKVPGGVLPTQTLTANAEDTYTFIGRTGGALNVVQQADFKDPV